MTIKIIGLLIGILILVSGIYYLIKCRHDAESKKIYIIFSIVGLIICAVTGALLIPF